MRRDSRKKQEKFSNNKILISGGIALLAVIVVVFSITMYGKQLNDNAAQSKLNADKIATLVPNNEIEENTTSASSTIGKTIEETENTINNNIVENITTNTDTTTEKKQTTTKKTKKQTSANTTKETSAETKKELSFIKPVEGEVVREFAKDNLTYSNTLKEWITHLGVDIKADKTTVVKAAEAGTVKSIKNDPRYGLTIVIDHGQGFQTVYSNLLTSEFVVEGEKVKQGQSIGTVGNSAVFEISDDPHLHFEIFKDGTQIDPMIYIK